MKHRVGHSSDNGPVQLNLVERVPAATDKSTPISVSLDAVFTREAVDEAVRSTTRNRHSAPGPDGICASEFKALYHESTEWREWFLNDLLDGTFKPSKTRVVQIPKDTGGTRTINVANMKDRVVGKVIGNEISTIMEPAFHPHSYGFRPHRNTLMAARKALQLAQQYPVAVEIDFRQFFDNCNRDKLASLLRTLNLEPKLLDLIRRLISVRCSHEFDVPHDRHNGIPQGLPLSPILANVYLNPFDWYLSSLSIPFVRYADDLLLFFKDQPSAEEFFNKIERVARVRFKAPINAAKSRIVDSGNLSFLGWQLKSGRRIEAPSARVREKLLSEMTGSSARFNVTSNPNVITDMVSRVSNYFEADNFDELCFELCMTYSELGASDDAVLAFEKMAIDTNFRKCNKIPKKKQSKKKNESTDERYSFEH